MNDTRKTKQQLLDEIAALQQRLAELESRPVAAATMDCSLAVAGLLPASEARLQTERQRVQYEIQRAGRLALVGQLTSGIAHEIGTPLNVIAGNAELLRMDLQEQGDKLQALDAIIEQTERITGLLHQLLTFARDKPQPLEAVTLTEPLHHALRLLALRFKHEAIRPAVDIPSDLPPVWGASNQLEQVFINILVNAWHAMPTGGTITIQARTFDEQQIQILFRDNGIGMSATEITRAFEPFFSTKDNRGTGLGLAICQQIIDSHRGTIALESAPGTGTTVLITLWQAKQEL